MSGTELLKYGEVSTTEILGPIYSPEVIIKETESEVDQYVADLVINQAHQKPESVFINPTGNTQLGWYDLVASAVERGEIDISQATFLNLDEYWPLQKDHPNSYWTYMMKNFMSRVKVGAWYIPDSSALDPEKESERFQGILDQHQPADLAILGIGPGDTCHIGFNEKGSPFDSRVRYIEKLDSQTIKVNATLFDNPVEMPQGAITQGIQDIMHAQRIILVAKGGGKALGINQALRGPISSHTPASFLRYHPNVTIVLDKGAAKYLPKRN
jgi:glucosamine-6-phosphate deaminase